jgi:hypothetical protein
LKQELHNAAIQEWLLSEEFIDYPETFHHPFDLFRDICAFESILKMRNTNLERRHF